MGFNPQWPVVPIYACFTVDTHGIILAVYTYATTVIFAVYIQTLSSCFDVCIVVAFFGMTKAITSWEGIE